MAKNDFDLSQFEVPITTPKKDDDFDLSQFEVATDGKSSGIVDTLKSGLRKAGITVTAPVSGFVGRYGDYIDAADALVDYANNSVNTPLNTANIRSTPTIDNPLDTSDIPDAGDMFNLSDIFKLGPVVSGLSSASKALDPIKQYIPSSEAVYEFVNNMLGGAIEPQTASERVLKTTGKVVGGGLNVRNLAGSGSVKAAAKSLIPDIATGAAVGTAIENDLGAGGVIASGIGGRIASTALPAFIKSPAGFMGELLRVSPKNLREDVINIMNKEGVDGFISARTTSPAYTWLDNRLSKSWFSKSAYNRAVSKLNDQMIDFYGKTLDKISAVKMLSPSSDGSLEAGTLLQQGIKSSKGESARYARKLYTDLEKRPGASVLSKANNTKSATSKLLHELGSTKAASEQEEGMMTYLRKLLDNLDQSPGGRATVKELMDTRKSLNKKIKYEKDGDISKRYMTVLKAVDRDIKKSSSLKDPNLGTDFKIAKANYKDHIDTYRNNVISSILKSEIPERTVNHMGTVTGLRQIKRALATNPQGEKIYSALARYKLEQIFGKSIDVFSDGASYQRVSTLFKDKKTARLIKELSGNQHVDFNRFAKASRGIAEGASTFANPSFTANVGIDAIATAKLVAGVTYAVTQGDPGLLAGLGLLSVSPFLMSKLITNGEFVKGATRLGQQGRLKNGALFIKEASRLAPIVFKEISNSKQVLDEAMSENIGENN